MVLIKIKKDEITPMLTRLPKNLDRHMKKALYMVAKSAQHGLRREITRQRLKWTGHLWSRTRARRQSRNKASVFVPVYGVQLDGMDPHWVSLKRGRNITQWARTAPNSPWKGSRPRQLPRAIRVKPHPWIQEPLQRAIARAPQIMKRYMDKVNRK